VVWLTQDHFVDLSDFDSPEDFVQRGIGFYLEKNGTVVGAAYSSLVCSKGIEVSLFVLEDYRRQGIVTILASRLLKWCIANNADANWDAANPESCKLAEKLGYIQRGEYQAHYLVDVPPRRGKGGMEFEVRTDEFGLRASLASCD